MVLSEPSGRKCTVAALEKKFTRMEAMVASAGRESRAQGRGRRHLRGRPVRDSAVALQGVLTPTSTSRFLKRHSRLTVNEAVRLSCRTRGPGPLQCGVSCANQGSRPPSGPCRWSAAGDFSPCAQEPVSLFSAPAPPERSRDFPTFRLRDRSRQDSGVGSTWRVHFSRNRGLGMTTGLLAVRMAAQIRFICVTT